MSMIVLSLLMTEQSAHERHVTDAAVLHEKMMMMMVMIASVALHHASRSLLATTTATQTQALAGRTLSAAEQRLGEILTRDETQVKRHVLGVFFLLERIEPTVLGMRSRPQLRRLEHIASRVVLLEQSRVEYLTRVDCLIVERDQLHAARPECDRREVGRIEATRVRVATYELTLRVLNHVNGSFFANLVQN